MPARTVSVAIVSYNTKDKLRRCLEAISQEFEVIVVDNASADGSSEMVENDFPHVQLIKNVVNRGFGAANNQAAAVATGSLVLYLNSDAYAFPHAIADLAEVFDDEKVVAAGGMLLNMDGTLQTSTANRLTLWAVFCEQFWLEKLLPKVKLFSPYWNTHQLVRTDGPTETPQVMGACLMTRRSHIKWDERFFLYCEDTDLCLRLSTQGKILYVPYAKFTHELGSSSKNRARAVGLYNRGKELYFEIHHGKFASAVCFLLDRLGALYRVLIWGLLTLLTVGRVPRFREQLRIFTQVLRFPRLGPKLGP